MKKINVLRTQNMRECEESLDIEKMEFTKSSLQKVISIQRESLYLSVYRTLFSSQEHWTLTYHLHGIPILQVPRYLRFPSTLRGWVDLSSKKWHC